MDIDKPKSWRGFLIEIGTIIVGILIALAVNQVVDDLRERRITDEARAAVRTEIAENLEVMQWREAEQGCIERRLEELSLVLRAAHEGRPFETPHWIGRPTSNPTFSSRWSTAAQSGRASLFGNDEQSLYAGFYYPTGMHAAVGDSEQVTWATLRAIEGARTMSPAMIWGLEAALSQARYENFRLKLTGRRAFEAAEKLHIRPRQMTPDRAKASVCLPIGTGRQTAVRTLDDPFGAP